MAWTDESSSSAVSSEASFVLTALVFDSLPGGLCLPSKRVIDASPLWHCFSRPEYGVLSV